MVVSFDIKWEILIIQLLAVFLLTKMADCPLSEVAKGSNKQAPSSNDPDAGNPKPSIESGDKATSRDTAVSSNTDESVNQDKSLVGQAQAQPVSSCDLTGESDAGACAQPKDKPPVVNQSPLASPDSKKSGTKPKTHSKAKLPEKTVKSPKPTTIEEFGFRFDDDGVLADIKTGGPFEFMVSNDHSQNQRRYEALGEVMTETVYGLLETRGGLKRHYLPEGAKESDPRSFIFVSDDWKSNADKMLVLIHGSGVVRAGQWTRKLIINNSLRHGTQLPYIQSAKERGYSVVVLNTNLNSIDVNGKKKLIKKNESPEDHTRYVWKNIISKSAAKKIAIVAHSYGGVCTLNLAREFKKEFSSRVFAIAFTDSVHGGGWYKNDTTKLFSKIAINWCANNLPLDTLLSTSHTDAKRVSAGDMRHEWTSYSSHESVFTFLEQMDKDGKNTIGWVEPQVEIAAEAKADDDVEMASSSGAAAMQAPADQTMRTAKDGAESPAEPALTELCTAKDNENAAPAKTQQSDKQANIDKPCDKTSTAEKTKREAEQLKPEVADAGAANQDTPL